MPFSSVVFRFTKESSAEKANFCCYSKKTMSYFLFFQRKFTLEMRYMNLPHSMLAILGLAIPQFLSASQLVSSFQLGRARLASEQSDEISKSGTFSDLSIAWEEQRSNWRYGAGLGWMTLHSKGDDYDLGVRQIHDFALPKLLSGISLIVYPGFAIGVDSQILFGKGAQFDFIAKQTLAWSLHLGAHLEYRWMRGNWGMLAFLGGFQDFSLPERSISWSEGGVGFVYSLNGAASVTPAG